jgi:non-specific serine/threonine protein kinase
MWGIAWSIDGLAAVACAAGQAPLATTLYASVTAINDRVGAGTYLHIQAVRERNLGRLRLGLDIDAFSAAWQTGQEMSLDEAVREALSVGHRMPSTVSATWDPALTRREHEVVNLVAHGLTNAGIARSLGISERTVAVHVHHTLRKLGLESRRQIADWAGAQQTTGHSAS